MSAELERIQALRAKLVETFVEDADPKNWAGADIHPRLRNGSHRGDRSWEIKNAVMLGTLLARTMEICGKLGGNEADKGDTLDVEEDVDRYSTLAKDLMSRVSDK